MVAGCVCVGVGGGEKSSCNGDFLNCSTMRSPLDRRPSALLGMGLGTNNPFLLTPILLATD